MKTSNKPAKPAEKALPLTYKQRRLVQGIAQGMTQRKAARYVDLHETYACNILKEPKVRQALAELMDRAGLSDKELLVKHCELLHAEKLILGFKEADGGSVDFIEVPDFGVQVKALELAYKLKGAFVEKNVSQPLENRSFIVLFGKD